MSTVALDKVVIADLMEKKEKSNLRETGIKKEIEDNELALLGVQGRIDNADPLPATSIYASHEEQKLKIEKEIQSANTNLANIETNKVEIRAYSYFLENAPE